MGMDLVPVYEEPDDEPVEEKEMAEKKMAPKERKIKYWVAPMDANFRRDEPGKSLMGMDLVPVYEEVDDMGYAASHYVENSQRYAAGLKEL